jgi:hypothetical protein
MAVIQIYLPSREGANNALDVAQTRQNNKPDGKGSRDPVSQAHAALTEVDQAEAALNTALEDDYEIKAQYPAMHGVGLNIILYKPDSNGN